MADKADPRREAPRLPRLGHMRIISHLLHFVKPLFLVLFPALSPTFSVPLWLSPALLRLSTPRFPLPVLPRGGGRQSGCGKAGAAERARLPPQGAAERTERLLQGLPRQKSGGSPRGLPPCLISVVQRGRAMRPAAGAAASDLSRPAAARGADSVPKQTRKKPRRRGTGRTVGNARRGNNAAARRSDAVSPPLLPQSAGAQTRRAGAYT